MSAATTVVSVRAAFTMIVSVGTVWGVGTIILWASTISSAVDLWLSATFTRTVFAAVSIGQSLLKSGLLFWVIFIAVRFLKFVV